MQQKVVHPIPEERPAMLVDLAVSLRPRQWVKNVFVLPALIFSHNLFQPEKAAAVLGLFAAFCLLASSAYLLNDIADRCHPIKRLRTVATGRLVVLQGPYSFLMGSLIYRTASHLDAFSADPFRPWLPGDTPGGITGTPAGRPPRSSRTRGSSRQTSSACDGVIIRVPKSDVIAAEWTR